MLIPDAATKAARRGVRIVRGKCSLEREWELTAWALENEECEDKLTKKADIGVERAGQQESPLTWNRNVIQSSQIKARDKEFLKKGENFLKRFQLKSGC